MNKRKVGVLVFMLVIGFAAVATTLVINGTVNISFDDANFPNDVIFADAKTTDGTAVISDSKQNINFETKKLKTVGDIAVLDFVVGNKNRQYDANVTINCGLKDTFRSFDEYLNITITLASPFKLAAGENKNGKLTIKLTKAYADSDTALELICALSASPVSRSTVGGEYIPPYKKTLNGAEPVLDEEGKLVPITLADDGVVTYADKSEKWYDYDAKEWANAIILVDNPSKEYNVGDTISESDIESYFVWIPRFKYRIFDTGNYFGCKDKLSESIAKEIQIEFGGKNTSPSYGSSVYSWLTHPAFTNYNTNGIWVGKFETGYAGATDRVGAQVNRKDASKVIVKPNVYSWRVISVSNIFKTALEYEPNMASHMMRNTEWGAVAYLSHSKYGINDEVRINNNSNYLTGYAANTKDAGFSSTNNSPYNTDIGYLASTTGNITGVYDMSGGAAEFVAGYRANTPGDSGFTTAELTQYAKYFDEYYAYSEDTEYKRRILGDATGEMGPFYNPGAFAYNNWYNDISYFVNSAYPWFLRGGDCDDGSVAGQFAFNCLPGDTIYYITGTGFRLVLLSGSIAS